jgi:hypothetical protein
VMSGTTLSAYCGDDSVNYEYSALSNACTCPYIYWENSLKCE